MQNNITFKQSYTSSLYIVVAMASLGGLLAGFDMGIISGALIYIEKTWAISDLTKGWIVSAAIVGSVIGAAVNGFLADIFGRKKIISATSLLFIIASLLCGIAENAGQLIFYRILIGIAVGMVTFVVPLYLSEISPQHIRGTMVSLFQLAITAGILLSYLVGRIFALNPYNWRLMLASGIIPAAIMSIGILFLHDTPRWLIKKGRIAEAEEVFSAIEPTANIKEKIAEIEDTLKATKPQNGLQFFSKSMIKPIIIGIGIMFMQICTGINTVIYYTTTIFKMAGFTSDIGALYATIGVGVVNFFMTIVAIIFADKIGRKPLLYMGLIGMLCSLLLLSLSFAYTADGYTSSKWLTVISVMTYIASFAFSLGPIGWILVSEILPLRIRGLAMSICTIANFGFNFAVVLSFLPMIHYIGEAGTFLTYAFVCIFSLFFVYFFIPETKGHSLEEIENIWH
jgi:sugar porter (SP) family MFS transporter